MVITIGRSCGSGGLEIAQKLAGRLGVRCYDADALLEEATRAGCAEEMRAFLAEKPVNSLLKIPKTGREHCSRPVFLAFMFPV